ncbi:MAG: polyprenyl diphosphate synthase [Patescibacteria group bacterium]
MSEQSQANSKLPSCLGFIMDGNRRWANSQGLDVVKGHEHGHEVFVECGRWLRDNQIRHAVFYAFSTENWNRPQREVDYLMNLISEMLAKMDEKIDEEGVRVRIVGRWSDFSEKLQAQFAELEEKSKKYDEGTTVWIALSYGGRAEIVAAVNQAIAAGKELTEANFEALLWSAELPEPDMIVRTSGEHRLSGFMTWKGVYSELHFIDKHWPALTRADFDAILEEYGTRERRRGT